MGPITGQTFVDSHVVSSEGKDTSEDEQIMSARRGERIKESRKSHVSVMVLVLGTSCVLHFSLSSCMTLLMKLFWNCETLWRLPHAHEGGEPILMRLANLAFRLTYVDYLTGMFPVMANNLRRSTEAGSSGQKWGSYGSGRRSAL